MEGLTRLVSDSLARHGIETALDYRRLQWSKWFHCESSVSFVLAPSKPGIFALAEEMISAGETAATNGKRMLALIRIAEAGDLGMALGRMFLPGSPERDRLLGGHCFARYAVIEDEAQRHAAYCALQQWMASSAEALAGTADLESNTFAWGGSQTAEPNRESAGRSIRPPAMLPSGF
ncbi:MAG: hypothetical protein DMG88_19040 [Acidobacteria bacterium]|nr:MAG: hypothetical protein DMG88_19040 [Acidobacteriota bacterium]